MTPGSNVIDINEVAYIDCHLIACTAILFVSAFKFASDIFASRYTGTAGYLAYIETGHPRKQIHRDSWLPGLGRTDPFGRMSATPLWKNGRIRGGLQETTHLFAQMYASALVGMPYASHCTVSATISSVLSIHAASPY